MLDTSHEYVVWRGTYRKIEDDADDGCRLSPNLSLQPRRTCAFL